MNKHISQIILSIVLLTKQTLRFMAITKCRYVCSNMHFAASINSRQQYVDDMLLLLLAIAAFAGVGTTHYANMYLCVLLLKYLHYWQMHTSIDTSLL